MNFTNLYCHLHPHQLLINYCNASQCQSGLCPNCIGIHTQQHLQKGTSPNYENIRDTYQQIVNQIQLKTQKMQQLKRRITVVEDKAREKKSKLREIVEISKKDVMAMVDNFYRNFEKQIFVEIEYRDSQKGLHCEHRLKKLVDSLSAEQQKLKSAEGKLKSFNFIDMIQKIKWQQLYSANMLQKQIEEEIQNNQDYIMSIFYDKKKLSEIHQFLSLLIQVQIGFEYVVLSNLQYDPNFAPSTSQYSANPIIANKNSKFEISSNYSPNRPGISINEETPVSVQLRKFQQNVLEGNKVQNLFTLRGNGRPSSQQSAQTICYNSKKQRDSYKNKSGENTFKLNRNLAIGIEESRLTIETKFNGENDNPNFSKPFISQKNKSKVNNYYCDQLEKVNLQIDYQNQSKEPKVDYNFTFGSQVYQYNPFSIANKFNEVKLNDWEPKLSRFSQNIETCKLSSLTPARLHEKRMSNNITKMEKLCNLNNINSSQLRSFDTRNDDQDELSSSGGILLFNTQFI